jgi:putative tricarboxylic transport membrane protein
MRRDKGNLTAGIVLASFGLYVISVAVRLPYVSDVGPGPGFFPLWLGIGLVLFASTLIFTSITSLRQGPTKETEAWRLMARSLSGWLALMIAIALLGSIGFVASFIILTIFSDRCFRAPSGIVGPWRRCRSRRGISPYLCRRSRCVVTEGSLGFLMAIASKNGRPE